MTALQTVNEWRKKRTVVAVAAISLSFLIILISAITSTYYNSVYVVIVYLFYLRFSSGVDDKYVASVLYRELDAEKFKEVVYLAGLNKKMRVYTMLAHFYCGDIKKTVELCRQNIELASKKKPTQKHTETVLYYYTYLAYCYFFLNDAKSLELVLNEMDLYIVKLKEPKQFRKGQPILQAFSMFCKGEYADWVKLYEKYFYDMVELENREVLGQKEDPRRLDKINKRFIYACACYWNGNAEAAAQSFRRIIELSPKLYYSRVSETYLCAIETGADYRPPEESEAFVPEAIKNKGFLKLVFSGVAVSLAAGIAVTVIGTGYSVYDKHFAEKPMPVHFQGIEMGMTKDEVLAVYGNDIVYYHSGFLDDYVYYIYRAEFLGVQGYLQFDFETKNGKTSLILASFGIHSPEFTTADYKAAVNKTINYFRETLTHCEEYVNTDPDEDYKIGWYYERDGITYLYYDYEGDLSEDSSDYSMAVFYLQ
ncbi:MAG: hypothetical protein IJN63_00920 [Clostridia bacterium]|nr:hypothetical protein [Clostridia bacterium]